MLTFSYILNLFKSLSNLGFDQKIQMGIKFKKIRKMKNTTNSEQYCFASLQYTMDSVASDLCPSRIEIR
jgi:hypothetical protein